MRILFCLLLLNGCALFKTPILYSADCGWYKPVDILDSYEDEFIKNDPVAVKVIAKNNLKYDSICK